MPLFGILAHKLRPPSIERWWWRPLTWLLFTPHYGYYGFDANISFTFQEVKNLSAHPTYLCSGPFCKCFGEFWIYLEIESFSQRSSNIYRNRIFWRFGVVLKLVFEVKNWQMHTKQLSTNLGCHFGNGQLSGGVP